MPVSLSIDRNIQGQGGLEMFANRLKRNIKEVIKKAKLHNVTCFRLYDKDVPQVPVAIDHYLEDRTNISYYVLQYFRGPFDGEVGDDAVMDSRIDSITEISKSILNITSDKLFVKLREKKKGKSQYNKLSQSGKKIIIRENNALIQVNLSDYLDTGIFFDHRPLRMLIRDLAFSKSLLNLFSYTSVFSLQAALGEAKSTTNVDISSTYLDWGRENFRLNGFDLKNHKFIEEDIWDWVESTRINSKDKFDIILLDPPTFSNSKKKNQIWDIQLHHSKLIESLLERFLAPDGVLYFSTNYRKFKLHNDCIQGTIQDITESTIPFDYRDGKIHKTFEIRHKF